MAKRDRPTSSISRLSPEPSGPTPAGVPAIKPREVSPAAAKGAKASKPAPEDAKTEETPETAESSGAQVVSLDSFRKKT